MKRSQLYLAIIITLLMALPAAAQTFPRRPVKEGKTSETKQPDRVVTALPVIEGDPDETPRDRITIQQLKQKLDDKADIVILDVRSSSDYRGSLVKIPGAVRIPPEQIEARLNELPKDKEIVTYCSCVNESTSGQVAQVLLDHGFKSARALIGGLDAWEAAGYLIEPKDKK
jgi:rhodanese-related sulfurtransferase